MLYGLISLCYYTNLQILNITLPNKQLQFYILLMHVSRSCQVFKHKHKHFIISMDCTTIIIILLTISPESPPCSAADPSPCVVILVVGRGVGLGVVCPVVGPVGSGVPVDCVVSSVCSVLIAVVRSVVCREVLVTAPI